MTRLQYVFGCDDPTCFCVVPNPRAQCEAIQRLVRPHEAAPLMAEAERRGITRGRTASHAVAAVLSRLVRTGRLRFEDDPNGCDRWCSPRATLRRGSGDCDDHAILAASCLRALGVDAAVVVGRLWGGSWGWHAWVEGYDQRGWFLLEATLPCVHRSRPAAYDPRYELRPGACRLAA